MAEVFVANRVTPTGEERVALKTIRGELARSREFLTMFRDEARIVSRLRHPNVVRTFEQGEIDGQAFIAMERLTGRSLWAVWDACRARGVRLRYDVIAWIGARVADGLHYAHELRDEQGAPLGIVHRDVNPSNVFVTAEGTPKVIDFGLAKAANRASRTATGIIKGKVAYMAPEQASGEAVDRRADVFALAATLWELSCDRRLFKGEDDVETLAQVRAARVPDPTTIVAGYPPALWEALRPALARDPRDRTPTAAEFARALDAFVGGAVTEATVGQIVRELFPEGAEKPAVAIEPVAPTVPDVKAAKGRGCRRALVVAVVIAVLAAVVTLLALLARPAAADTPRVLPPSAAPYFQQLLVGSELAGSTDIEIDRDHVLYRFQRGDARADIEVRQPGSCEAPSGPLCLRVVGVQGPGGAELAATALHGLDERARAATTSPWDSPSGGDGKPDDFPARVKWMGVAFLVVTLVGCFVAIGLARKRVASREGLIAACLGLLAYGVRLWAVPFPADIRDVLGMADEIRRAGWACYLTLVFGLWPTSYETIWALHRVLGALAVPLLYCVMRARAPARVATAAAALLAVLPLAARFSASDTPYVPLIAAFLAAIVAFDAFAQTGSKGALVLGTALLTCAMQLRPEGPWLVVPATLLSLGTRMPRSILRRPSVIAVGLAFVAVNIPFSRWGLLGHRVGQHIQYMGDFVGAGALYGSPWLDFGQSPWPATLLVLVGAWVALWGTRAQRLLLAATIVAFPLCEPCRDQLANTRYHLPSITLACGLAGLAVGAGLDRLAVMIRRVGARSWTWTGLAVVVPCLAVLPRLDFLHRTWTPELEFERFRRFARALPRGCTIVTLVKGWDAGFSPFTDPGRVRIVDVGEVPATPPACLVYYRAGNCVSPDATLPGGDALHQPGGCKLFEDSVRLIPIEEGTVRALPYRGERYDVDPIPVGFFRLEPR